MDEVAGAPGSTGPGSRQLERRQLYCIELRDGRVKLGISLDPERRARDLTGMLVGAVPCSLFVERLVHALLAEHSAGVVRAGSEVYWPTAKVRHVADLFRKRSGQRGVVEVLADPWPDCPEEAGLPVVF